MNPLLSRYKLAINVAFLIALATLSITGCANFKFSNYAASKCGYELTPIYHTPLTDDKFNSLINGDDQMSWCVIGYFYYSSGLRKVLHLSGGRVDQTNYLNSITVYLGNLLESNTSPSNTNSSNKEFSASEIQPIFNYLENNQEYFFDNSEYEGLTIPFECPINESLCNSPFVFSIGFFEPNDYDSVWDIVKCVDEYPAEGTPLYGLFQMLENDFITQFEE